MRKTFSYPQISSHCHCLELHVCVESIKPVFYMIKYFSKYFQIMTAFLDLTAFLPFVSLNYEPQTKTSCETFFYNALERHFSRKFTLGSCFKPKSCFFLPYLVQNDVTSVCFLIFLEVNWDIQTNCQCPINISVQFCAHYVNVMLMQLPLPELFSSKFGCRMQLSLLKITELCVNRTKLSTQKRSDN